MAEERDGARVLAHCMLGGDAGVDAATSFLDKHPDSPMASRIRSACTLP